MSENQIKKRNSSDNAPRREKFRFDNIDHALHHQRNKSNPSLHDLSSEMLNEKNKQVFLKMPSDFKEDYMKIVKQITSLFNELRDGLHEIAPTSEKIARIKDDLEEITSVDTISGCFELLRRGVLDIVETVKQTVLYDYESLLQETEAKVRDHIRNEQQLKVAYESLQFKLEESEKKLRAAENETAKRIEELTADNTKLVELVHTKDSEISRLSLELNQKNQVVDMQTQALNKMLTDSLNQQTPMRNSVENKATPYLLSQKINDHRPIMNFSNTTINRSAKTPSPSRSFAVIRNVTPENAGIPFKLSQRTIENNVFRKKEFSPTREASELGYQPDTTAETAETINASIPKEFSSKNIPRSSISHHHEHERGSVRKAHSRERGLQSENIFANMNVSQSNLRSRELLNQHSTKNQTNKLDKMGLNDRKSKFIEELDKIFKIKRQNNLTMDNPPDHYMNQSREQQSMNRYTVNEAREKREASQGKIVNTTAAGAKVPKWINDMTAKKRPLTSSNITNIPEGNLMPSNTKSNLMAKKLGQTIRGYKA